jgi:hypothetical protein
MSGSLGSMLLGMRRSRTERGADDSKAHSQRPQSVKHKRSTHERIQTFVYRLLCVFKEKLIFSEIAENPTHSMLR